LTRNIICDALRAVHLLEKNIQNMLEASWTYQLYS